MRRKQIDTRHTHFVMSCPRPLEVEVVEKTLADVFLPLSHHVNELPVKQIKRCMIMPWCEQPNMINDSWVKGKACWTVGCKQMLSEWVRNKNFVISLRTLYEQSHEYWKLSLHIACSRSCLATSIWYFVYFGVH